MLFPFLWKEKKFKLFATKNHFISDIVIDSDVYTLQQEEILKII